jgi:hypothetical protein
VLLDESGGLGVDVRVDQVVKSFRDDLLDLVHPPALAQRSHIVPGPDHGLLVGTRAFEDKLRIGGLHHVALGDQAVPIERPAKRQRA